MENTWLEVHRLFSKCAVFWVVAARAESKENTQFPSPPHAFPLRNFTQLLL